MTDVMPCEQSFHIGCESNPSLMNNGGDQIIPITANMILRGLKMDCTFQFLTDLPAGSLAEVLYFVQHVTAAAYKAWFKAGDTHYFIQSAKTSVVGSVNNVGLVQGAAGAPGMLDMTILKSRAPYSVGRGIYIPLNCKVAAGDYIFLHMDHMGMGPVDSEMVGVIYYQ